MKLTSVKEFMNEHYRVDEGDKHLNEIFNSFTLKLEDGNMKVISKEVVDGTYEIKISYGRYNCTLITNDSYEAYSSKGDVATLFNMLIQQIFIDGMIKSS